MDSILGHLFEQEFMVHLVKCLCVIQVDAVCVLTVKVVLQDVVKVIEQLSETAVSRPKTVLLTAQKVVGLEVSNKLLSENTHKDLYDMRCQGYRAVVCCLGPASLLVERTDKRVFVVVEQFPLQTILTRVRILVSISLHYMTSRIAGILSGPAAASGLIELIAFLTSSSENFSDSPGILTSGTSKLVASILAFLGSLNTDLTDFEVCQLSA